MLIEMSKLQGEIVTAIIDQHTIMIDKYLTSDLARNLKDDERKVMTSGCKIMKELSRQIKKKMEKE